MTGHDGAGVRDLRSALAAIAARGDLVRINRVCFKQTTISLGHVSPRLGLRLSAGLPTEGGASAGEEAAQIEVQPDLPGAGTSFEGCSGSCAGAITIC